MFGRFLFAFVILLTACSFGVSPAQTDLAACRLRPDGTYDLDFGVDGVAAFDFGAPEGSHEYVAALAFGPDNTIVVVGRAEIEDEAQIGLARLTESGHLDAGFSSDGRRLFDLPGDVRETVSDLVVDGKGKITIVGSGGYNKRMFAVVRFESDGGLSETFGGPGGGTQGYAYFDLGVDEVRASGQAIANDGDDIIVAGSTESESGDRRFAIARLNPSGSFVNSFGIGGKCIDNLGGYSDERIEDIYIDSDHRIVAAGHGDPGGGGRRFMIMRYDSDGSPNRGFNACGFRPGDFRGTAEDVALSVAERGGDDDKRRKVLAAGYAGRDAFYDSDGKMRPEKYVFAAMRCNPDGTIDKGFGAQGYVLLEHLDPEDGKPDYDTGRALKVAVQSDGKVVLAGYVATVRREDDDGSKSYKLRKRMAVVRLNEDGSPDPTFGMDGWVFIDLVDPERSDETAMGFGLQSDAKIVVAGAIAPTVPITVGLPTRGAREEGHPKGNIVVRIFKPPFWRFRNQATAVGVHVPGGHDAGDLNYDPDIAALTREGIVAIEYLMPGGRWVGEGGRLWESEGDSYWRDDNCMMALRDVVRYALGLEEDSGKKTLAERIGAPSINSVGLFAFSAGGNHAISTLAKYGADMEDDGGRLKWYAGSENPTRSEFNCGDLGHVMFDWDRTKDENGNGIDKDEGTNGFQTDFNIEQVNFDWEYLEYDRDDITYEGTVPIQGRAFFDGNRNGKFDYVDFDSDGCFMPDKDEKDKTKTDMPWRSADWKGVYSPGNGEDYPLRGPFYLDHGTYKIVYSRPIRKALEEKGFKLTRNVASIEEMEEWWKYRETIPRVPDLRRSLPHLKVIQTFSNVDHAQSSHLNYAQLHVQEYARALNTNGIWYRLNPDRSYVHSVYNRMTGAPPDWKETPVDNNANVWVNYPEVGRFAECAGYDREYVFAAGVLELIDRCYTGNWSDNLDGVPVEPYR